MSAVVDKPLIQYAVEEAVAAGVQDLIFVTGRHKRAIEDRFDASPELEAELEAKSKDKLLHVVQNILPKHVNCIFVRQPVDLGLGHAVLCARPAVGEVPITKQLVDVHAQTLGSVLAGKSLSDRLTEVTHMVEKPAPEVAPSTLAVAGRYVLTPDVFDHPEKGQKGVGGEIQLTDAIEKQTAKNKVFAYRYQGRRYDCGSKLVWTWANTTPSSVKNLPSGSSTARASATPICCKRHGSCIDARSLGLPLESLFDLR